MKAIFIFWPKASSPKSIEEPSARMSPLETLSPSLTIGLWFMHVF